MKKIIISFFTIGLIFIQSCKFYEIIINSTEYQKEYPTDTVLVEIPNTYELLKIAQSLTGVYQEQSKYLDKSSDYYHEVMEYYGKYDDHKLVRKLNISLKRFHNVPEKLIRSHSTIFNMDTNGKVSLNDCYLTRGYGKILPLPFFNIERNKDLIEDFCLNTNSLVFFRQHQQYYDSLINLYHHLCDFNGMWFWLENQFPDHYDSYRIIFSPLSGGFHNTEIISSDEGDYSQILMFVSAPRIIENRSFEENSAINSRMVFTETDHNYVNPVTSEYLKEIKETMGDYKRWNEGKQRYPNAYLTFNEYMTWSVFCLYATDTYTNKNLEEIIEYQEKSMCENRGFIKFREFNRELIELFNNRSSSEKVMDLYPEIIEWMKNN